MDAQNVCLQLISGQPNDPYPTPIMYDWLHNPKIDMGTWFLKGFGVFGAIKVLILAKLSGNCLKINQICQYSSYCRSNDPYPAPIMYDWLHNPKIDMGTWFLKGLGVFGAVTALILAQIERKLPKISQSCQYSSHWTMTSLK